MTTLLAANDGGHLVQLYSLVDRFGLDGDRLWVTVRTPQTESMLAAEQVTWVGRAPTRDWRAAARNSGVTHGLFRRNDITRAISTVRRVVVSLGTSSKYGFRRLLDRLVAVIPDGVEILVPRRAVFEEHVDDHQGEIAGRLRELGLAVVTDVSELTWERIVSATAARVLRADQPPRFRLDEQLPEDGTR